MGKEPLYRKIAGTIAGQIRSNTRRTGEKLPSLRTVVGEWGVSLNTAISAYFELERMGLIVSRPKSGYVVAPRPPRPDAASPAARGGERTVRNSGKPRTTGISGTSGTAADEAADLAAEVYRSIEETSVTRFSLGVPEDRLLPVAKLNRELVAAMRELPGSGTRYEDTCGNLRLRQQVARFAYSWGGTLTEEDLITTAGATDAMSLALATVTRPGDTVAVESPVYFGTLRLAEDLGLRVAELPTDPATGIDPDALRRILPQIRACLLISDFSNPLGCLMPDARKREVVEMLAERDIPLIEDDLYGDLFFGIARPKPCKAYDPTGNVIWCGSVSKTLAPGYRVGWVAPGRFKEAILRRKHIHRLAMPTLNQEAVARFMENDRYENHLRRLRGELRANAQRFAATIAAHFPEGTHVVMPQGGFMMWVELNARTDTEALYFRAMDEGISIAPGRMFSLRDRYRNCMRLSYGQRWTPFIEERLRRLGELAKSQEVADKRP